MHLEDANIHLFLASLCISHQCQASPLLELLKENKLEIQRILALTASLTSPSSEQRIKNTDTQGPCSRTTCSQCLSTEGQSLSRYCGCKQQRARAMEAHDQERQPLPTMDLVIKLVILNQQLKTLLRNIFLRFLGLTTPMFHCFNIFKIQSCFKVTRTGVSVDIYQPNPPLIITDVLQGHLLQSWQLHFWSISQLRPLESK